MLFGSWWLCVGELYITLALCAPLYCRVIKIIHVFMIDYILFCLILTICLLQIYVYSVLVAVSLVFGGLFSKISIANSAYKNLKQGKKGRTWLVR